MLNKVMLIGNIGSEVTIRDAGNSKVCNFSMITESSYKKHDGSWTQVPTWHKIEAWGVLAENIAKYAQKGYTVYVEGSIGSSKWTDNNGVERTDKPIKASVINILRKPGELSNNHQQSSPPAETPQIIPADGDDDLPF